AGSLRTRRGPGGTRPRVLRLRGEVPRRRLRVRHPGEPARTGHAAGAGVRLPYLLCAGLRRAGQGGLLRHARARYLSQRDQYDARVHRHLHVPADVGGLRPGVPEARLPPRAHSLTPRHWPALTLFADRTLARSTESNRDAPLKIRMIMS